MTHYYILLVLLVSIKSQSVFNNVTCGSVFKLVNNQYGVRLHSHSINYGSGSGQQSVTAVEDNIDSNSLWQVKESHDALPCQRGEAIPCNSIIRLFHLSTKTYLHSHHFQAPMTTGYEVSALGPNSDSGDDWKVLCSGNHWTRDESVKLRHMATDGYLSISGKRFNRPISGQYEVVGFTEGAGSMWKVEEGIYVKPTVDSDAYAHDEL